MRVAFLRKETTGTHRVCRPFGACESFRTIPAFVRGESVPDAPAEARFRP